MTNTNGQAAEIMIRRVLLEEGFGVRCPFSTEDMLKLIEDNSNYHYDSALYHIEYDFGFIEIASDRFADRCLGCDGFIEDGDGNLVSYDVSVNSQTYSINHKLDVKAATKKIRNLLGISHHIIVLLSGDVPCYRNASKTQKELIFDSILKAADNKEDIITIKF